MAVTEGSLRIEAMASVVSTSAPGSSATTNLTMPVHNAVRVCRPSTVYSNDSPLAHRRIKATILFAWYSDIYTSSEHVGRNPFQARVGAREYSIKRFRRDNGRDEYNRNFRTILGVETAFEPWPPHKNGVSKGSLESPPKKQGQQAPVKSSQSGQLPARTGPE